MVQEEQCEGMAVGTIFTPHNWNVNEEDIYKFIGYIFSKNQSGIQFWLEDKNEKEGKLKLKIFFQTFEHFNNRNNRLQHKFKEHKKRSGPFHWKELKQENKKHIFGYLPASPKPRKPPKIKKR